MKDSRFRLYWYNKITFKISFCFIMTGVITLSLLIAGLMHIQQIEYRNDAITTMSHIENMLAYELMQEGDTFLDYQDYMLEHSLDVRIPYDFDAEFVQYAENKFDYMFIEEYPNKVFGIDVKFDELPDKLKTAFCTYYHAKWFLRFEDLRTNFSIPYVYYVYPNGNGTHLIYIFDTERTFEGNEMCNRLHLMDDYEEDPNELYYCFATWEAGHQLNEVDVFDNEWGHNYSHYTPLYINGKMCGLVCSDMDIDFIHSSMIHNTIIIAILVGLVYFIGAIIIRTFIQRMYVNRIDELSEFATQYTINKDYNVKGSIRKATVWNDEIGILANCLIELIDGTEKYIKKILKKDMQISETRERAMKDGLTGVKNRLAYDEEIQKLQWAIEQDETDISIAMIDLNYLKRINDTFGHEHGDDALQNLCRVICEVFKHAKVFRIGGDEFTVILRGEAHRDRDALMKEFQSRIAGLSSNSELQPWEGVSAAIGLASYNPESDISIDNVFKRADAMMYDMKCQMKSVRVD